MAEDSGSSDDDERMRARERETRRKVRNDRMLSPAPSQIENWDDEARQHDAQILQSLLTRETEQLGKLHGREVILE